MTSNVYNVGNQNVGQFTLTSEMTPLFGTPVVSNNITINGLNANHDTTIVFSNIFSPTNIGTYTFSSNHTGVNADINPTNNDIEQEIIVLDTTQSNINLCYANNLAASTLPGINWSGGNGGIGVYFEPSFYPAKLISSNFGIDLIGSSFTAKIYDDDGPNGEAGTLIDSVFVDSLSIVSGWNNVPLSSPYIINDGGVYVLWYMNGSSISLERENISPISRQTHEFLSGFWSKYRDYQTEDFFISIDLQKIPFAEDIGVSYILSVSNGSVQIEISNYGINNVSSFNVGYSANGGNIVSENISSNLLSGGNMNYLFSTLLSSVSGQVEVCSWTEYPIDMQNNNDTTCITTTILSDNIIIGNKEIVKVVDILGRETREENNELLFYIYDDGTVEKRIIIE
jgi:hypothetical protein